MIFASGSIRMESLLPKRENTLNRTMIDQTLSSFTEVWSVAIQLLNSVSTRVRMVLSQLVQVVYNTVTKFMALVIIGISIPLQQVALDRQSRNNPMEIKKTAMKFFSLFFGKTFTDSVIPIMDFILELFCLIAA